MTAMYYTTSLLQIHLCLRFEVFAFASQWQPMMIVIVTTAGCLRPKTHKFSGIRHGQLLNWFDATFQNRADQSKQGVNSLVETYTLVVLWMCAGAYIPENLTAWFDPKNCVLWKVHKNRHMPEDSCNNTLFDYIDRFKFFLNSWFPIFS